LGNRAYLDWITECVRELPNPKEEQVLNTNVVSAGNGRRLHDSYMAAKPFPLIQMRDMFSNSFLEEVFDTLAVKVTRRRFTFVHDVCPFSLSFFDSDHAAISLERLGAKE